MNNNRILKMILMYLEDAKKEELEIYVEELMNRNYVHFTETEDIIDFFLEYRDEFYQNTTNEEVEKIRMYSGILASKLNAVLRNNWTYEQNGLLMEDEKNELNRFASKLDQIITKQTELPDNIKTYRGVNISFFRDYGISSLEELKKLKGQYYFDSGFTSTSLIRERSFFDRDLEFRARCNIEIEYLIPKEAKDVLFLLTQDLSYSPQQTECLINKGNLSKIVDVKIDLEQDKAEIKAALIPKEKWDPVEKKSDVAKHRL